MKTSVLVPGAFVAALAAISAPPVPIVQVRDLPNAPSLDIVAWESGEAQFGLRTRLRRDGSHLGEGRVGEHRFFLSSVFVDANGGFNIATAHNGKVLRKTANARDVDACRFGNVCSPSQTAGLGISDELLRENRDSFVVTFRPKTGRNWSVRLERRLIDAYLTTMDSVSASLRKE